jgi:hypothetical protein
MLEVPAWANRLVLILMAIGFPAVLLSWQNPWVKRSLSYWLG